MNATVEPYLVVQADRDTSTRVDTPQYQEFLAWLRFEGVTPEQTQRCEVFEARDGKQPYAVVTLYELDENGSKILSEVSEEFATYTDIVTVSSLPPSREV